MPWRPRHRTIRWRGLSIVAAVSLVGALAIGIVLSTNLPSSATNPSNRVGQPQGQFGSVADRYGYLNTSVGCIPSLEPTDLDQLLAGPIGPLIGWDNPQVYPLGEQRWLWLVQDSYLDYVGADDGLRGNGPQIQNLAILQEGTCFTLLHRGTTDARLSFEVGDERSPADRDPSRFFWPLGGELDGDRLRVFWSEMRLSDPKPRAGDGIIRHPVATWLAEYDASTLERLSFELAPNSGVFPSYGLAVSSDETHSYLFGNSNLLNLDREGGFLSGPHSATRMYLARVPRGQLDDRPEYRTKRGWSRRAADAVAISKRFWAENTMRPRFIDGKWISVSKVDGFWGDDITIDVAKNPWGPWRTVSRFPHEERSTEPLMNSYAPIILPWSSRDDGVTVVISENAQYWPTAVKNPVLYRPRALGLTWPSKRPTRSSSAPITTPR